LAVTYTLFEIVSEQFPANIDTLTLDAKEGRRCTGEQGREGRMEHMEVEGEKGVNNRPSKDCHYQHYVLP